jgi:hypothetical protein
MDVITCISRLSNIAFEPMIQAQIKKLNTTNDDNTPNNPNDTTLDIEHCSENLTNCLDGQVKINITATAIFGL